MKFQDELKANLLDKTKAITEQKSKRTAELLEKATNDVKQIRLILVNAAKQGEYEVINGQKILTATWFMPPDLWTHKETTIPATYEKRAFGRVVQTVPQRVESKLFISPEKEQDYKQYLDFFRDLATPDEIEIVRCFFENKRTLKKVDVPYIHTDILPLMSYEWFLKIECRTIIQ